MKSETIALLNFMKESKQLEIPIYQRTYSWEKENCEQLWEDIVQIGKAEADEFEPEHFVGTVIYIEKRNGQARYVIDGQQRLTTAALIIEALAQFNEANREEIGASAEELRRRFLFDPTKMGDAAHKLLLSQTDKETLMALVAQEEVPENYSIRIHDNFSLFKRKIRRALKRERAAIWRGLNRLTMISIALDQSQDQEVPQRVFESMNDRGVELDNADLILHYLLMGLSPIEQRQLYDAHWLPIENMFGQTEAGFDQEAYSKHFDDFIRYYLGKENRSLPTRAKMYDAFKTYANKQEDIQTLMEIIQTFAGYYSTMKLGREEKPLLKAAFDDLQRLNANTPMPFLLELYERYADYSTYSVMLPRSQFQAMKARMGLLTLEQFEEIVRLIESYLVRRDVCGLSRSSSFFASICRSIGNERLVENLSDLFRSQTVTTKRFPKNDEFQMELQTRKLYGTSICAYILRRMENYGREEPLNLDDYDVEPILPTELPLSREWQEELGINWREAHEEFAGTLGNMTLTKGARYLADRPFAHKRDLETGYRNSRLWLNELPGKAQRWDAAAIRERTEVLTERALEVWQTA